jgi:SAM-dependent methyltransferase
VIEERHKTMNLTPIIKGAVTFIPGMYHLFAKQSTGGTDSAEYCYGLWLKHLTMLWKSGMRVIPETMAELGPGNSLGVGLAALLSGVENYYALDIVRYAHTERDLVLFDELVDLFTKRAGRPSKGWPDFDQHLDVNFFPSHILTEKVLDAALAQERVEFIRNAVLNMNSDGNRITIKYVVPWSEPHVVMKESVDMILSHSVLEHVDDLEATYKAFALWLKPKGWISHQIDFRSHGLSKEWNGHWAYSDWLWRIIVGRRPYLINRQPCSTHLTLVKENGFEILCHLKRNRPDGIKRSQLAPRWGNLSEDDLTCSETFVQAQKT